MEDQNRQQLINQAICFLQKEREIYGDFNISIPSEGNKSQPSRTSGKNEVATKPTESEPSESPSLPQQPTTFNPDDDFFNRSSVKDIYYYIDKCQNLEELKKLCLKADILKTDLDNAQLVFGVGNPDADLVLVGEAPGAEEDKQGEPFVGRAGQLLTKILDAINFKRDDVYITNILKHRPPNNRNPKPEERKRSLPFLLRQIDLISPKLILALGKVSAQTLLDKNSSLTSMREKFHPFRDRYELLATYHPAALLRHSQWKRPTWEDVQLLRKRYDELDGQP